MNPDWLASLDDDSRAGWEEFVDHFRHDALEKIASSGAFISIVPQGKWDVKFAVELGAAIMLDKPILAVAQTGADVPEKLRLVADEVVEVDIDTEEGRHTLAEAVTRMVERSQA